MRGVAVVDPIRAAKRPRLAWLEQFVAVAVTRARKLEVVRLVLRGPGVAVNPNLLDYLVAVVSHGGTYRGLGPRRDSSCARLVDHDGRDRSSASERGGREQGGRKSHRSDDHGLRSNHP